MTARRLLALFAALGLLLAACGDDDGGLVESANESSEGDSSGNEIDLGDVDLGDFDLGDIDDAQDAFDAFVPEGCEFFLDFSVAVAASFAGQGGLANFDASDAPAEIRDDVRTVLAAFDEEADDQSIFGEALSDPEVEEALDNIDAYTDANCDPAAG